MLRYLPFTDLRNYQRSQLGPDLVAALAVTFLCIPQGIAYAMIAGLPPAMGLYAGAIPTIVASLLRSSRHMVTGPANAVSLLIGTTLVAGIDAPPMVVGVTLALMVGVLQISAGALRLGALVDFISGAVVLGFITAAGILIALGQLPNVTGTQVSGHHVISRLVDWVGTLGDAQPIAVGMAVGTALLIWGVSRVNRRLPAALIGLTLATALAMLLGLEEHGLRVIRDLSPVNAALPPLTLPDLSLVRRLVPLAVAVTMLAMVESTSMARTIARRTGQRLDISVEFTGEGVANVVGAFFGAYPVTGSLARSALNEKEGATSRIAGVASGFMVLLAPLALASLLDHIPIAALAGMLIVVASRLLEWDRIQRVMRSHNGDRLAFLATVLSTFVLSLEQAIYVGVGISLVNVLRRARLLATRDLVVDSSGHLREVSTRTRQLTDHGFTQKGVRYCSAIHVLNVQGSLFFGAASQLKSAIDDVLLNPSVEVLVLRLKRVRNLDVTTLDVLENTASVMEARGHHLVLLGMSEGTMDYFERTGLTEKVGAERLFPNRSDHWFAALEDALRWALDHVEHHECAETCPYRLWLNKRDISPEPSTSHGAP